MVTFRQRIGDAISGRGNRVILAAAPFSPVDPQYADTHMESVPDSNVKPNSTYTYGEHQLDPINRFKRFQQVTEFDSYVFAGLMDLALTLGKGFEVGVDDTLQKEFDKKKVERALEAADDFSRDMDLQYIFTESARLLCQDGTVALVISTAQGEDKSDGILRIEFAPMPYCTLFPKGFDHHDTGKNAVYMDGTLVLKGPVDRICMNEFTPYEKEFSQDRFVLMRYAYQNYEMIDRHNRRTIGIYGRSLLEPVMDIIRYRQNLLHMNDQAFQRYGKLLLHYEYTALAKLLEERQISVEDAQKYMNIAKENGGKLQANQDIYTAGWEIEDINSSGSWDVDTMKKSYESDIANALFGSASTSGQAGMTFASAYVTRMHKIMGMESLRRIVKTGIEDIIHRHLNMLDMADVARAIVIKLDPINEPEIDMPTLVQLNASGKLTDERMYQLLGWNFDPVPEEEQMEKQEQQMKMQLDYSEKVASVQAKPAPGSGPVSSSKGSVKKGVQTQKKSYDKE